MRPLQAIGCAIASIFAIQTVGCLPVSPQTRVYSTIDVEEEAAIVFVTANRYGALVEESLRQAGIDVAPDLSEATAILRVKIGGPRSVAECGGVHNVLFDLRQDGERVATVKARGWVGRCEQPNVLNDMARELARTITAQ